MRTNPYPDEPTRAQPTDIFPLKERMEDLPPKPTQPPIANTSAADIPSEVESAEIRQEEARTIRYAIGKLNDFLQWFVVVLEVTLAIRFFLELIGADPINLFAGFIYSLTNIFLFPFAHIVPTPSLRLYQLFDWPTLIAMIMYWLLFWAIRRFLRILISGPEEAPS